MGHRELRRHLRSDEVLAAHPSVGVLLDLLFGDTELTASGYPYISHAAFLGFIRRVPHLFGRGLELLDWAARAEARCGDWMAEQGGSQGGGQGGGQGEESVAQALRVLRAMVGTAAVTAPSDLWLMRQILSEHRRLGIVDDLLADRILDPETYAARRGLDRRQLKIDFHFLYSRGWLDHDAPCFMAPPASEVCADLERIDPLPERFRIDWTARWIAILSGTEPATVEDGEWLALPGIESAARALRSRVAWVPTRDEIELGYRLVPMVLALRGLGLSDSLGEGESLARVAPAFPAAAHVVFERCGLCREGRVTSLGARVFQRAPGPFGIIQTYQPYLVRLDQILRGETGGSWVRRGENVAASQDANAKTFRLANKALDAFCHDTGFSYQVFIEHAVGKGEATRQRFASDGETLSYFGADLEDAAIDAALAEQERGLLPRGMRFIRQADIGQPVKVIEALRDHGLPSRGAVMVVGNGFHEIRQQTNEQMMAVFRGYRAAGIVLLFTEETGLADDDLRATAWNTYHAGFRWVHETSGQGLRPAWDREYGRTIWSWRRCAEEAGYRVLDRYTRGTRPIYPIPKPDRENPSISMTYFCVPAQLADELGC